MPDETVTHTPEQGRPAAGGADLSVPDCPPGCVLVGRYQVQQQLGAGGMGAVYRAVDTTLNRVVAIKVLPPRALPHPAAVSRFRREAQALARLSDPHIVQVYDAGEDRGRHFLVMEYVDGGDLAQLLKTQGRVPPGQAAAYARQVALALQHAHDRGLVHRDVKPSNILLGRDGRVKLSDLGLARFLQDQIADPGLTAEGSGMGTPDYMPPEQFRDAHTSDSRADVYGLGCTLYHLLTGRVPFPGSSLSEKRRAHQSEEPSPLEEGCPEAPAGLAQVVGRTMAKRPEDRFQTAGEVAGALAPYAADAARSTTTWQGGRFRRRKGLDRKATRWLVLGATAALLLALFLAWFKFGRRDTTPAEPDPNVLTVAQDGTGRFRSIAAALDEVRPGMTIRVADGAVYREKLSLVRQNCDGITLEATNGATIAVTGKRGEVVFNGVRNVTFRGFRLRAEAERVALIKVEGPCPGLRLEGLEAEASQPYYSGVEFHMADLPEGEPPMVVRQCVFRSPDVGIGVVGLSPQDYRQPSPCGGICLRDNTIIGPGKGIVLWGASRRVHVVGNQVRGARLAATQLENLLPGAGDILIANNTFLENVAAFRLFDTAVKGERIQFSSNLILGAVRPDMVFIHNSGSADGPFNPGDGRQVLNVWQVSHNWREVRVPAGKSLPEQSWVPPGPADVRLDRIEVLSGDPKDADFLRPAKDSPLAVGGVGGDLPTYVGAVPPAGVAAWDWDETWTSRFGKAKAGK